jgi:hypothetical protein
MQKEKFMCNCGICGSVFQFGPHIYNGKHIAGYQLTVCNSCWQGNWDGWNPTSEKTLIAHLNSKGIPLPQRNAKDRLPRE